MTASAASIVPAPPRLPAGATVAIVIWLGLAVAAGASGFLLRLPFPGAQLLNLVPTFFVPLLFANHVLIFRRLVGSAR